MEPKSRVAYFYDNEVGNFMYASDHAMKPHRLRMVHNLLLNYGLVSEMQIYVCLVSFIVKSLSFLSHFM